MNSKSILYVEKLKQMARAVELHVLVFGPAKPSDDATTTMQKLYEVKLQIKSQIESLLANPASSVAFPDDPEFGTIDQYYVGDTLPQLVKALVVDAIIVFYAKQSRAILTELDALIEHRDLMTKTYILVPKGDKNYLNDRLFDNVPVHNLIEYTQNDIQRGMVINELVTRIIDTVALSKLLRQVM